MYSTTTVEDGVSGNTPTAAPAPAPAPVPVPVSVPVFPSEEEEEGEEEEEEGVMSRGMAGLVALALVKPW